MKKYFKGLLVVFATIFFFSIAGSRAGAVSFAYTKSRVNVRDHNTGKILGTVDKGEYFEGTSDNTFLYTNYKGKKAKIYKSVLSFDSPKYMYVTASVNIRDQKNNIIGVKHRGDKVYVVRLGNQYRYYDKGVKFLYYSYLTEKPLESNGYATTAINIRDAKTSDIIGLVNKGTFVKGIEKKNYLYFTHNSREAKIYKPLIKHTYSKTRYVKDLANIRDHNNKVIDIKKAGSSLKYSVLIGDQYRFYENGVKFIHKSLVSDAKVGVSIAETGSKPNKDQSVVDSSSTSDSISPTIPNVDITKIRPLGFMASSANGRIVLSWEPIDGASGYEVYEALEEGTNFTRVARVSKDFIQLDGRRLGQSYKYYVIAYSDINGSLVKSLASTIAVTRPVEGSISTIKNYLTNAIAPMGSTLYILGGGRDEYRPVRVNNSTRIGLHEEWRDFFLSKKGQKYDPDNYAYKRSLGVDCSGFVGFVNYNTFNTSDNQAPMVTTSGKTGDLLESRGLGSYSTELSYDSYQAGDVMFRDGHVYIVVGQCSDGSVVVAHSSMMGVKLAATRDRNGNSRNQANALVKSYMSTYFQDYHKIDSGINTASNYLTNYKKFTWNSKALSDPDGYRNMPVEEVLKDLFKYK